jgi:hypothetical protein
MIAASMTARFNCIFTSPCEQIGTILFLAYQIQQAARLKFNENRRVRKSHPTESATPCRRHTSSHNRFPGTSSKQAYEGRRPRLVKEELTGRITENFSQPQAGTTAAVVQDSSGKPHSRHFFAALEVIVPQLT